MWVLSRTFYNFAAASWFHTIFIHSTSTLCSTVKVKLQILNSDIAPVL